MGTNFGYHNNKGVEAQPNVGVSFPNICQSLLKTKWLMDLSGYPHACQLCDCVIVRVSEYVHHLRDKITTWAATTPYWKDPDVLVSSDCFYPGCSGESLGWIRNITLFLWKSWKWWKWRGRSGHVCWDCCPNIWMLTSSGKWMDGGM